MSQKNIYTRLSIKNTEYFFLHELENGFELSPKEARAILESVKTIFNLEESTEQEKEQKSCNKFGQVSETTPRSNKTGSSFLPC